VGQGGLAAPGRAGRGRARRGVVALVAAAARAAAAGVSAAASAAELSVLQLGQDNITKQAKVGVYATADGKHVYSLTDSALLTFTTNPDGTLTLAETLSIIGGLSSLPPFASITGSPDGKSIYVGGYVGAIGVFTRDPDSGSLTAGPEVVDHLRDDSQNSTYAPPVEGLAVSPDGLFLYAASGGRNALEVYIRDPDSGDLSFLQELVDGQDGVTGLQGPLCVVPSPDGRNVYVCASVTVGDPPGSIVVLSRGTDGRLTWLQSVEEGVGGVVGLNDLKALVATPDGTEILASGREATGDPRVVRLTRAIDGSLSLEEAYAPMGDGADLVLPATWLALRPDGGRLYAGGYTAASGTGPIAFGRDPATGALSFRDELGYLDPMHIYVSGLEGATTSPDGRVLYVTDGPGGLYVFATPEPGPGAAAAAALTGLTWLGRRSRARASRRAGRRS
jgi:6-phosphogluconolactonase (cycloisomerase 2 family)